MNLIVDIGNSRIKLSVFVNRKEVDNAVYNLNEGQKIINYVKSRPEIKRCIISSVSIIPSGFLHYLKEQSIDILKLNHTTPLPIKLDYKTPETLGIDRIAAMAGAQEQFPSQDVLVIDAGTAITFDVKLANGSFIGGNISPGLSMRFKALNQQTKNLPLLGPQDHTGLLGQNTKEAIIYGVQNGIIYEVNSIILELEKTYPELKIIFTGGDAQFFDNKLKKAIFVISNLVSIGLNSILNYNVSET